MKKIFTLIAVALFGAGVAGAQSTKEERKASIETQRQELMETRHQIRAGIGVGLGKSITTGGMYQNHKTAPTYSLEYSYRVVEFLEVGAYAGVAFNSYDYADKFHCDYARMAVGVHARYSWFNRSWISLYSSAGLFLTKDFETYSNVTDPSATNRSNNISIAPDLVPIGVRIGGKLFGYFEPIAFTGRGAALMFGVGFKF